tara:strand:- start:224 stop:397 length:174 start_codon:yes stop_codon:yes gene_type:complete
MNKEPKELTRENCPQTRHILFWSKVELSESAHLIVQHYKKLKDADTAELTKSEWIIN